MKRIFVLTMLFVPVIGMSDEFKFTEDEIAFVEGLNKVRPKNRPVVLCPRLTLDCREWAEAGSPYHPQSGYYRYHKNGSICENIWNGDNPLSVLGAMQRSPGHNSNLKRTNITRIGIGRGSDELGTKHRWAYRGGDGPIMEVTDLTVPPEHVVTKERLRERQNSIRYTQTTRTYSQQRAPQRPLQQALRNLFWGR